MTERRSGRRIEETPPWETSSSPTCCRWGREAMNGVDEAGVVQAELMLPRAQLSSRPTSTKTVKALSNTLPTPATGTEEVSMMAWSPANKAGEHF